VFFIDYLAPYKLLIRQKKKVATSYFFKNLLTKRFI